VPIWAQVGHDQGIVAMKRLDYLCLSMLSLASLANVVLLPSANGLADTLPSQRVAAYFATAHLAIGTKWIVTQCVPALWISRPSARADASALIITLPQGACARRAAA
jgi:hypothetical protein